MIHFSLMPANHPLPTHPRVVRQADRPSTHSTMSSAHVDYYKTLGISKSATDDEIKKAYVPGAPLAAARASCLPW